MTTRRALLVGAGAAATGLFRPAIRMARAAEPITFFTPFGFSPDFIEIMNAKSGGYFDREGLDVTVRGAQGTAQAMQQLVAGQGQFIRSAQIDQMGLVAKQNLPIVCIATIYQGSNFFLIFSKDRPLTSAADLKGKTIGVVSTGGSTQIFLELILGTVGLTLADVTTQVTGNSPGAFQFIKQGRIDAFMGTLAVIEPLERQGEHVDFWSTDKFAPMPSQGYLTTRDTIARNPEMITRFLRAVHGSANEILFQPQEPIYRRAMKDFDIVGIHDMADTLAVTGERWKQLWLSQGRENLLRNVPSLWQQGVDELRRAHVLDIKDVTALYTNTFIDEALKG